MKIKTNQTGSAHVVIVLIIVLGVIAFVGWKVNDNDRNAKSVSTTNESTNTQSNQTKINDVPTKNIQKGNNLEIPEMGIKLTVSNNVSNLYYVYGKTNFDVEGNVTSLSTTTLRNIDPKCGADQNWTMRIASTKTPDAADTINAENSDNRTFRQEYPKGVMIGDMFFYHVFTNGACSSDTKAIDAQSSLIDNLKNQLKIEKL